MIRYGEAKKLLSKFQGTAGKCPDAADTDIFVKKVLQYMLIHGAYGNLCKVSLQARDGCITLPPELETPLKIKIDNRVGNVWNRWFEYHIGNELDNCCLAQEALFTQPNRYPTVYDPPCESYIGVLAHCCEDEDASVVIKGVDASGRTIYTMHNGEQIVGEYLTPRKGKITRTTVKFAKITEVAKTVTKGYITLYALSNDCLSRTFLSDYSPYETSPSYQRARIVSQPCPPCCEITILGRIRLKDYYSDDDLIPFDNYLILETAGSAVNSLSNKDLNTGLAQHGLVKNFIETEANFKSVNNGQPLEFFRPLSGALVKSPRQFVRRLGSLWNRHR